MSFDFISDIIARHAEQYPADFLAFIWFWIAWIGYNILLDGLLRSSRGLSARMHLYRVQWMITALQRENRVVETNVIQNLQSSVSFFASTAILVIAGLLAMLSSSATALSIIKQVPFASVPSKAIWYTKVFLLIYLFIYAFFKLTWSLRQMNYCAILVGAMPIVKRPEEVEELIPTARRAAMVATMAAKDFNRGIRSYYFAVATLSWLINPYIFIVAVAWVIYILFRREFHSKIMHVLSMPGKAGTLSESLSLPFNPERNQGQEAPPASPHTRPNP